MEEKGTCVEEGDLRGRGSMRGRVWTGVVIDGRIGLGGWEEKRIVDFFIYTPVFSVSWLSVMRLRE